MALGTMGKSREQGTLCGEVWEGLLMVDVYLARQHTSGWEEGDQEGKQLLKLSEGMSYLETTNLLVWPECRVQM